jgi:ribosome recycling factor
MIKEIMQDAQERMQKSIEACKAELAKIRTGRAHPSLLEHITVSYYGADTPLNQVANISVEDARTLSVTPFDKTMAQAVEKAIMTSDLGLNPNSAGHVIRIPMPLLTEERRKELTKVARNEGEKGRVSIRNIRRDGISQFKELLKEKEISEDDERRAEDDIQKVTDTAIKQVDEIIAKKESELLEI